GSGTVTVTGSFIWDNSSMSGTGATNLLGNSTLNTGGGLASRTLNNFGTFTDNAPLTFFTGAVVNNESSATWNLHNNASITVASGSDTFNNFGTLTDSSSTTLTINVAFNNSGAVNVQSGALTVLGDGIESGTITVAGGTSVTFSAGSDTFT